MACTQVWKTPQPSWVDRMAVRPILAYPDERLLRVSSRVEGFDAALRQLVTDLQDTMAAGPAAVGIAAPQIDVRLRVVIVDVSGLLAVRKKVRSSNNGRLVLVNPEIRERRGEQAGREGCLSVPDYTGTVSRAAWIRLAAADADGAMREIDCEGFEARAVQHELDHLDGVLFLDRVISPRELFRRKSYRQTRTVREPG